MTPHLLAILPDSLFCPLASNNKHKYWELLSGLHQRKFGPDAPIAPSDGFQFKEILADIEDILRYQTNWAAEDSESLGEAVIDSNFNSRTILHRLIAWGWLREERFGIEKRLTMTPLVSKFLGLLVSFTETDRVFVGGEIKFIHARVSDAVRELDAASLSKAAKDTRALIEHIRNSGINIRDLMDSLQQESSLGVYIERFSSDYIESVFIGDYKELRTKNHPLALRPQIIENLEILQSSEAFSQAIINDYAKNFCNNDLEKARQMYVRDISRISSLEQIDDHLARLDVEVKRANQKTKSFLDYQFRSRGDVSRLTSEVAEMLSKRKSTFVVSCFAPGALVSGEQLAEPKTKAPRLAPSVLRKASVSPEVVTLAHLYRLAALARSSTPEKIEQFILSQTAPGVPILSSDLKLSTPSDVVSFQKLLFIAQAIRANNPSASNQAKFILTPRIKIRPINTEAPCSQAPSSGIGCREFEVIISGES